jgi:peptidyl-prolyl cis-trans isomerase D
MLQFIRSKAGTFAVRLLFVFLIASFGIWGIGDFLRQTPGDAIALTVGADNIPTQQVQTELRRSLDRARQMFGGTLDMEQARALGLTQHTVDDMISKSVLDQEARRLNITIGDQEALSAVTKEPIFRGPGGGFDRLTFINTLAANHLSESAYLALVRANIRRGTLADVARNGADAPKTLIDTLYKIRDERRVADWVFLPESSVVAVPAPDDAALQTYYDAHHDAFTAPEYRGVTALILRNQDVASDTPITEDQIKDAYQQRLGDFTSKIEKRHVLQILLPDEATANAASAALSSGKSFEDVAKSIAKQDASTIDLGTIAATELPKEIADVAFAAKDGDVTAPVKSALGWHILKIAGIEAGGVKTLDEVHQTLEADLRKEAAGDALYKLSTRVEDAIAGGADLSAIAQQFNLKPLDIAAIDETGKDAAGKPVADLPAPAEPILRTIFETSPGQVSGLEEIPDAGGFYVVKVESATPPTLKPLDQVKDQVKAAWLKEQRASKLAEQAKSIVDGVKIDMPLAKLAAARKLAVQTTKPFDRANARGEAPLPPQLVAQLFTLQPGGTVNAATPDGQYIAELKEIQAADPNTDVGAVAQLSKQLDDQMKNELLTEFGLALRQRYPVTIHQAVLDSAIGDGAAQ